MRQYINSFTKSQSFVLKFSVNILIRPWNLDQSLVQVVFRTKENGSYSSRWIEEPISQELNVLTNAGSLSHTSLTQKIYIFYPSMPLKKCLPHANLILQVLLDFYPWCPIAEAVRHWICCDRHRCSFSSYISSRRWQDKEMMAVFTVF